jgi:hypothetical protein
LELVAPAALAPIERFAGTLSNQRDGCQIILESAVNLIKPRLNEPRPSYEEPLSRAALVLTHERMKEELEIFRS